MSKIVYPKTKKQKNTEVLHGKIVEDDYRWLEDDENEEVVLWQSKQNDLADSILSNWPDREKLRQEIYRAMLVDHDVENYNLDALNDWKKIDHSLEFDTLLPEFRPEHIFHVGKLQDAQQAVLFATKKLTGEKEILVNPNEIHPQAALDWFYPSPDGKYVAYGVSTGGDEQSVLSIIESNTKKILPDTINFTSFAKLTWLADSSGFYYSGGKSTDFIDAEKWVFFHKLGDESKKKAEEIRLKDPYVSPVLSEDGRYIMVNYSWEKPCAAYYQDRWGEKKWKSFLQDLNGESYGHFYGNNFFVLTNDNADRGRIISIPMDSVEDKSTWKEIVAESKAILQQFIIVEDYIVLSELYNAQSRLRIKNLKTNEDKIVELPGMGLIEPGGAPDTSPFNSDGKDVYFCYSTFTEPTGIYRYNLNNQKLEALDLESDIDLSHLTTKLCIYPSKDQAQVPLYLVYRKDLDLTKTHNVLLNGYGGWNINTAPSYIGTGRNCVLPFVEAGGIYAFACLRGGNELGRSWWLEGRREKKQNTFDDFYAAGEFLIEQAYTTKEKLAIIGASNGGLLTATAVTQRPDLFKVAVLEVPLTDMIRAVKDPYLSSYKVEYGDPEDPELFEVLISYSPVHNVIQDTNYPATFILSGENDIRCQPWNGRKMAALLQEATSGSSPILLKVVSGGHGPGLSLSETVERRLDMLGFIMRELDMKTK